MKTETYQTYCPIFTGFYNSIFDESDSFIERELQDEEEFREIYDVPKEIPWDYIENSFFECIDFKAGELAVAQAILNAIPELISNIVTRVEFEELRSPREYNFANDSIDCKVTVKIDALKNYLETHRNEFDLWLNERHTSRSGFISSYPNNVEEWEEQTESYEELNGHYLGAILDFVASEEMYEPEMDLYYAANGSEAFLNGVNIDITKLIDGWKDSQ